MRFLLSFCFIAAFGAVAKADDFNNIVYEVFRRDVVKPPIPNVAQTAEINYQGVHIISNINNKDHSANKMGVMPLLIAGGPGFKYLKIQLQGKVGHGINSTIVIYGHPEV